MGRYDEALADYTRAIELEPTDGWAVATAVAKRADTYQAMGRHDEALADYTRAIELDATDGWAVATAVADRVEIFRAMGRLGDAPTDYTRAIELDPDNASAVARRADTYQAMGRHDEALADYTRAIELDPDNASAVAKRGATHRAMGRLDEALADYTQFIERIHAGVSATMDFEEAPGLTSIEKVIALHGDNPAADEEMRRLVPNSRLLALGSPTSEGRVDLAHLLRCTVPVGSVTISVLPVFTRLSFVVEAVNINPSWQTLEVLLMDGAVVLGNLEEGESLGINSWSFLEFKLPRS